MPSNAQSQNADSVRTREYVRGFAQQTAWLQGKSLAEARIAYQSRKATLQNNEFNRGGDDATLLYVECLEAAPIDSSEAIDA